MYHPKHTLLLFRPLEIVIVVIFTTLPHLCHLPAVPIGQIRGIKTKVEGGHFGTFVPGIAEAQLEHIADLVQVRETLNSYGQPDGQEATYPLLRPDSKLKLPEYMVKHVPVLLVRSHFK